MTTVNTRKLKDGLSEYLRRAEKGERIVVMRGKRAVAALVPFQTAEGLGEDALLRQLAARDVVELPEKQRVPERSEHRRIPSRGKPASAMVLEDRR